MIAPCSSGLSRSLAEVTSLAVQPGWWSLPAVKNGSVYIVDHAYFSRPGPRCVPDVSLFLVTSLRHYNATGHNGYKNFESPSCGECYRCFRGIVYFSQIYFILV